MLNYTRISFFFSGASLAQDRGRLEARIEALNAEVISLKKQSERENDALKIKTKMVDDQTDTIRKLKEVRHDGRGDGWKDLTTLTKISFLKPCVFMQQKAVPKP